MCDPSILIVCTPSIDIITESKKVTDSATFSVNGNVELTPFTRQMTGGSGFNTAKTLATYITHMTSRINVGFCGAVGGNDAFSEKIITEAKKLGIALHLNCSCNPELHSAVCKVNVCGDQRSLDFIGSAGMDMPELFMCQLPTYDMIYITAYAVKQYTASIRRYIESASFSGSIVLNTSSIDALNYIFSHDHTSRLMKLLVSRADFIIGSDPEFQVLDNNCEYRASTLITNGPGPVVVTDTVDHANAHLEVPVVNDIVNCNGAGDALASGFLYGILSGKTMEEAASIGIDLARLVIRRFDNSLTELPLDEM